MNEEKGIYLSHSYSSLKMFENCPQRYYRQRILKDIKDEGGEASKYGERIHEMLERRLRDNTDLPQEIAHYETLCTSVEKLAEGGELHVEKELVLNDNHEPTGWWDKDAWLRSKLDVLVLKGRNAVVMDWKTGKRKPDFFQMEIFAAQVFKHFPDVEQVKSVLVWLTDMKQDSETYTRKADLAGVWGGIAVATSRVEQALHFDNWPARPSGLCGWCPAQPTCKWARR
jgi:RecB family exonuclease